MTQLLSCPFCGGPPVPIATKILGGGGVFTEEELAHPDGLFVRAEVFCHECGTQGPHVDEIACEREDVDRMLQAAVDLWNKRDQRNLDCYAAGEPRGLNCWPRLDVQAHPPTQSRPL